jgi:ubiquinone/menaquinone biosynthesis C-methylase UbiE
MQNTKAAYDEWHRRLPVDAAADTPWHRMIRESISGENFSGVRALEIGCGRGGFSCWMARTWPEIRLTAADFSDAAVDMGRSFAKSNGLDIEWAVADIQKMPWPDASFDTVFSCETIEHVPDPRAALNELARVLKPGGRLFLTVPNYLNFAGVHRIYRKVLRGETFREEGQPINHFLLLPLVCHWVRSTGLRISKVRSLNHSLPYPGREGIPLPWLDSAPFPFPWLGQNSFVLSAKPPG